MSCHGLHHAIWIAAICAACPLHAVSGPPAANADNSAEALDALLASRDGEAILRWLERHGDSLGSFRRYDLTGQACAMLGRWDLARDAYEQAVAIEPNEVDTLHRYGVVQLKRGHFAAAVRLFEKAALHGLDSVELHMDWARGLLGLGRPLGELSEIEPPQEALPGDVIGERWVVVRRPSPDSKRCVVADRQSALFHAYAARRLDPFRVETDRLVAAVWSAAGLREEASSAFRRAASRAPTDVRREILREWGECLFHMHDYEGYLARIDELSELPGGPSARERAAALCRVADVHGAVGDVESQIKLQRRAIQHLPDSAALHAQLGDALLLLGRRDEACDQWREATTLGPDAALTAELKVKLANHAPASSQPEMQPESTPASQPASMPASMPASFNND